MITEHDSRGTHTPLIISLQFILHQSCFVSCRPFQWLILVQINFHPGLAVSVVLLILDHHWQGLPLLWATRLHT